ncbi:hypothetical protein Ddc_14868 [Ditylenchus destructor]|nr:hypothetical protein Ddc_14868 [Ditylenchus destructor]
MSVTLSAAEENEDMTNIVEETSIANRCNRKRRLKVHPIWEKFEEVHKPSGRIIVCKKCSGELGIRSNTTVLKNHWNYKHKDEPFSWKETSTLSQESDTNDIGDAPDTAINPIPMQDAASTSETTVRINKCKLEPESDNGSDGLDPELENETIETQIKREKLRSLKLTNRLLELQIIEKERELGMSCRTDKGIQCDEWTTLIGQILR